MSPLVAYHATRRACRQSILQRGLLCHSPKGGHRPFGVYVFREDGALDHLGFNSRIAWAASRAQDLWEVAYIGPAMIDQYVLNGLVLLEPADHVTLVAGNQ